MINHIIKILSGFFISTYLPFYIYILCSQSMSSANNEPPPKVNTQYVPIGKLHPRLDFAGILINLNVEEAIKTGIRALQLADQFLEHHQIKQQISPWSGKGRNIRFMNIKQNNLADNLKMLQTDMHEIQQQYQIQPSSTAITSSRNTSRHKRGFNFDVTIDVGQCLNTIVDGVVSLFSAPSSIDKIQKSVEKTSF
jgi:hypothetical protein